MGTFHVNPATGNPGPCTAQQGKCPYGADAPHFSTANDARQAYEISQRGSWPKAPSSAAVEKQLRWADAATLERKEPSLNRPDVDFGFNWTSPGTNSQSRVSLAKWNTDEAGTLYALNASSSTAVIIARDITVEEVDEVWHEMLKDDEPMNIERLHSKLLQRY